ncbi:ATP-dependent protease HslVU (ClpYQ) peptidase subunit [Polaromonas sp. CG_9.5]|nr:ATP-dependent protease HslVU (ClpYQ) peptidase subunit [Polaromonas sp. CG_9.5]
MTNRVGVKKVGRVVMAADTFMTFGDTRLSHRFEANSQLFKVDTSESVNLMGMADRLTYSPSN